MRIRLELIEFSNAEPGGDGETKTDPWVVGVRTSTQMQDYVYVEGTLPSASGVESMGKCRGPSRHDLVVIVSGCVMSCNRRKSTAS